MKTYPIFRLAIPLAAGIFFADIFRMHTGLWPLVALLCLLVVLGGWIRSCSYASRWVFGAGTAGFMFLVGWILTEAAWRKVEVEWPSERRAYQGVVWESPQKKARSYQCLLRMSDKDVWLYLPKDSLTASLRMGDELLFYTRMDAPKEYLYRKGVSGTAYVPAGSWRTTGQQCGLTWKQKALLLRERMMEKYREWGIGKEQMPVLSALTLGYKGELDKETREAYSVAGISHVLALSGMHIGFIWLLLNGGLRWLMGRHWRFLRWLVVTLVLWGFAFVVGLEASVVRAVVMCMLIGLGSLSGSKALSMNTLAIAALFMLLYRPFYLFDISFQLSFVAVLSILVFYPMFFGCLSAKGRMARGVWGVMSVSAAAQLGTAPLVMYYFSNFSVYFLLTNLVASLLVPVIIYVSFLMIALAPWEGIQSIVVTVLNYSVSALNRLAEWIASLPYASVSWEVPGLGGIVCFYLMLALGWMFWKTRRRKWLIRMLAACVCWLALHLFHISFL